MTLLLGEYGVCFLISCKHYPPLLIRYLERNCVTATFAGHEVTPNGYVISIYRLVLRDDDLESQCYCYWYSHLDLPLQSCRGVWPIVIPSLVSSLLASEHYHSSSRRGSCDGSTSLAWVSCNSAGGTNPALASSFTSAAAALASMRPSSASLRVKRAISASYTSHSGICRARESFGSFCECNSAGC